MLAAVPGFRRPAVVAAEDVLRVQRVDPHHAMVHVRLAVAAVPAGGGERLARVPRHGRVGIAAVEHLVVVRVDDDAAVVAALGLVDLGASGLRAAARASLAALAARAGSRRVGEAGTRSSASTSCPGRRCGTRRRSSGPARRSATIPEYRISITFRLMSCDRPLASVESAAAAGFAISFSTSAILTIRSSFDANIFLAAACSLATLAPVLTRKSLSASSSLNFVTRSASVAPVTGVNFGARAASSAGIVYALNRSRSTPSWNSAVPPPPRPPPRPPVAGARKLTMPSRSWKPTTAVWSTRA